jgi:CRP/FNR family transcriptional regulator, cyclic AMP receptor protein
VDVDLGPALSISRLGGLPPEVIDELIDGAVRRKIAAGSVTHREREDSPHLELVLSGVIRAFVTAPDGRTMTIRYCRPGALLGAMSLFAADFTMPAATQAVVDAEVLAMSPAVVTRAAERDVRVARALLSELSERAQSFVGEIAGGAFSTVKQRVARHLLDLASEPTSERSADRETGEGLIVRVSQQELAAAVGTVREVVVRVLRELRETGAVRTERDRILIIDPALLIKDLG